MKILILLQSCNEKHFADEAKIMKLSLNNQIQKYNLINVFDVYDYIGNSNETYLNNSTIYVNSKDDLYHTYEKTIKCLEYINDNIKYDYIFRTNTSTFINIKILYEFITFINEHDNNYLKVYTSCILNTNDCYAPFVNNFIMQGKGMLFNKHIIDVLLRNSYNFNNYESFKNNKFYYDDNAISACLNIYHMNNNENCADFIGSFCHMYVFNKKLISTDTDIQFNIFNKIKHCITITLKDNREPNVSNIEKIKFLDNLFTKYTINDYDDLIKLSIEYDKNPDVFVGFGQKFIKLNRHMQDTHKIAIICTHKNHIDIASFVIDYWKKIKEQIHLDAYVFDNGSDDGSLKNFEKYDWIHVTDISQYTGGKLNDILNVTIKNSVWKQFKANYDYVICCDFDECPYCEDWDSVLTKLDELNASLIYPKHCNMVDDEFKKYEEGKLYHELNPYCEDLNKKGIVELRRTNRCYIINPKTVEDINYLPGQEFCYPIAENMKPYYVDNIYMFHLHYIGNVYAKQRNISNRDSFDENNKNMGFGYQLFNDEDYTKKQDDRLNNKVKYNEVIYPSYKTY